MDESSFDKGRAIRREMFGPAATDAQIDGASAFMAPVQQVVTDYCFGQTWSDETLPLKTRSLITLAALCALGRSHEMRIHARGALANGASPAEIRAVMMHTMVYAGVPLGIEGMRSAADALAEAGIDLDTLAPGPDATIERGR